LLSHTDGSGGASLLVDGFYAASIVKELHPKAYYFLSNMQVPAHAAGEPSALYRPSPTSGYPVLGHDPLTGELTQVRWNNDDRSVMSHIEPDNVEEWYAIFFISHDFFEPILVVGIKPSGYGTSASPAPTLSSGFSSNRGRLSVSDPYYLCMISFIVYLHSYAVIDNHRVLHGRSAFDGKRRMCGAYVGVDEYRSKLAVLNEKFAPDSILRATNDIPLVTVNGRNIWNSAL
jgi:trimethyllysine dioxygenase